MAGKTKYVVETSAGKTVEVTAERAEQDASSTRVTFFDGDQQVGSFIHVSAWYKALESA